MLKQFLLKIKLHKDQACYKRLIGILRLLVSKLRKVLEIRWKKEKLKDRGQTLLNGLWIQ